MLKYFISESFNKISKMSITITFGDCAENHKGMQMLGELHATGFTYEQLLESKQKCENEGYICELHNLVDALPEKYRSGESAYILIIKNGIDLLSSQDKYKVYEELENCEWDSKAFMYGRVVNKKARWNLCFDEKGQEPDYENKKGRIIAWNDIPLLHEIKQNLSILINGANELVAEGNYYYDNNTGIGYHGDSERKKVIGLRLGNPMNLAYQWYKSSKPIGVNLRFQLQSGDVYIMSEKATGNDWKKKNIFTLRHAAGNDKYTNVIYKIKKPKTPKT